MKDIKTFKYLTAVIIYGTIGYFLRFVNVSSEFVVMCRGLIGSLFILVVMLLTKNLPDFKAIKKNLLMLVISGASLGFNWIFLFAGYRYAVAITSLMNYLAPIFVVIITTLFMKEKLSVKQIICIVVAFIGIVLVSGLFDGEISADIHCFVYGLLAAVGFVILVLCNKKIKNIKPLDKTVVQLFASFLTVLPVVLIRHDIPSSLDTNSLLIILMLGIVHTGIAYILYFGSIDTLPSSKIAILGYVEPVLSIVIGTVVFNEKMSIFGFIGAILILGSALYNELGHK